MARTSPPLALRLTVAALLLGWTVGAAAQPAGKVHRLGWLDANPSWWGGWRGALVTDLKHRGWIAGQNLLVYWRQPGTDYERELDRLPEFAAQLVRGNPDVLVTWGNAATQAATAATRAIPIVFAAVDDPVGSGFVARLTRPGGNITGVASMASELADAHLKLLVEVLPRLSRVEVLRDPGEPGAAASFARFQAAGQAQGLRVWSREVREANDLAPTFEVMRRDGAQAVFAQNGWWMVPHRAWVAQLARDHGLPLVSDWYYLTRAGGLLSYRWDDGDVLARTAALVDKILKGANPGDLPVEQPAKFRLAINVTTAKLLGLTIPPSVLERADELIE